MKGDGVDEAMMQSGTGDEPIELLELVAAKLEPGSVIFVKVAPELFTQTYIENISMALSHVLRVHKANGVQFLIVPKDIDLSIAGDGYFTKLGYAKVPASADVEHIVADVLGGPL